MGRIAANVPAGTGGTKSLACNVRNACKRHKDKCAAHQSQLVSYRKGAPAHPSNIDGTNNKPWMTGNIPPASDAWVQQSAGGLIPDPPDMGGIIPSRPTKTSERQGAKPLSSGNARHLEMEGELAEVLGIEAAQALMSAFAGNRLYVPRSVDESHRMARAVGLEKANLFCEFWFEMEIRFPVSLERKRRVMALHWKGKSTYEIVSALLVSERFVFDTLAEFAPDRSRSGNAK